MASPICTRVVRQPMTARIASRSVTTRLTLSALPALSTRSFTSLPSSTASSPRLARKNSVRSPFQPATIRALSSETRTAIQTAISSSPVVLFMKGTPETPQCGFSRASIQILGLQGVDPAKFSAFNVLEDDTLRAGIKEFSEWPTIPQLYVDGEFVGGCDIIVAMHQSGELGKLLEGKGVVVIEGEGEEKKE